ncbi:unnamed protein product, partial [Ectocarpus fasciculatus]
GTNKCLDAFTVALNQACDGQEKCWYASTLELQLVSLEFCGACRSVQTLHVRVVPYTCPSLWSARQSHTTPDKRGLEVCVSSRVPAVQAIGLTWALPMEFLLRSPALELWTASEGQRLTG